MTTAVKSYKKMDFSQWTDETHAQPKTLLECLEEAGGFPFVARAVTPDSTGVSVPDGTEIRVVRRGGPSRLDIEPQEIRGRPTHWVFLTGSPKARRWVLVGHRS